MFSAKFKRATPRTGFDVGIGGISGTELSPGLKVQPVSTVNSTTLRPNSAPTTSGQETLSLVEQRLRIVKRGRAKTDDSVTAITGVPPPCSFYPVHDTSKKQLSSTDEAALQTLITEIVDSAMFPDVIVL